MIRGARVGVVAVVAAAAALAACGEPAGDDTVDDPQSGMSSVRFRLWDEAAASAYQESFDAFNAIHRDIHVEVEVVPQDSYATRVAADFASGAMADVFWVSSDAVGDWVDLTDLVAPASEVDQEEVAWSPAMVDLFTEDTELWAVPQLWETSALYANTELARAAGVDPATLVWDPAAADTTQDTAAADEPDPAATEQPDEEQPDAAPSDSETGDTEPGGSESAEPADPEPTAPQSADTLLPAVHHLTRDAADRDATAEDFDPESVATFGFNPDRTEATVWLPLLAQFGDTGSPNDRLLSPAPETTAVFDYLLELPDVPAPADARTLFTEGRLALFQSTTADLRHVANHAEFSWTLDQVPAGPNGPAALVTGVGAAANAHSEHPEATAEVLRWLSSTDGQSALASHSVGVPAALGAQELFARSWGERGVDVAPVLDPEVVVTMRSGARTAEAVRTVRPVLAEMFDGELPVDEALDSARRAAADVLD